ncbi:VOC family protein [Nocardioides anomalus]|uniref:VOC family protein n=1 Tax=Nocardioides anomalus TaxID=2712223 RepID=A0A6G6WDJ4_9ACTN|nr:VOC family protein [Nocardioides anomalus]QIG43223.1 VOC family protein [Nocardioides anomalus]
MRLDHLILACADVDAAAARLLAEHGLGSVVGGEHPAWGTRNRIIPAGSAYVELMGVGDRAVAETTPLGRRVLEASADGDAWLGLAVEPDDLEATAARLGLPVSTGSRTRPDGSTLSWRSAGMEEMAARQVPFFLAWDGVRGADVHPDEGGPAEVVEVELGGDSDELGAWLGGDVPGLTLVGGARGVRRVELRAPRGTFELGRT